MPTDARFPEATDDPAEARRYLENRAVQALIDGWKASRQVTPLGEWGLHGRSLSPGGQWHQTFYVYTRFRGQRRAGPALEAAGLPVATTPDCRIEGFLEKRRLPYTLICRFCETPEYRAVATHYGDRRAARSKVPYMNHIDEGLAVLRALGATDLARKAFCLHPLVQADAELAANLERLDALQVPASSWALALEYRRIANLALSSRELRSASEIELGPLPDVAMMLRADKVQNQKDFERHHRATHPRAAALERYFSLWLERLGIDAAERVRLRAAMEPFVDTPG